MEPAKQRHPCAVCTVCGSYTTNFNAINQRCGQRDARNKRCNGVYGSALNNGDWAECPRCHGFGWAGSSRCEECGGAGWHYVRGMR